jgi:hypothetical protein
MEIMESNENLRWLRRRVAAAESLEELELVEVDFGCDVFEKEPWTQDPARVSNFKHLLERYRSELSKKEGT